MKKCSITACVAVASMVALVMFCGNPQNPYTNPKSAEIVADSSLTSLKDSVKVFTAVPCTVSLSLPNLMDSIHVHVVKSGFDSIIAGGAVSSGKFTFDFAAASLGVYQLKVIVVRSDNSIDSIVKQVTVYVRLPVVTPDSAVYHTILSLQDSVTVMFTAIGPDSNLRFGYTWIDTAVGQTQTTAFSALKPFQEKFSRTVHFLALHAGLHSTLVCHAYAIDADSLVSAVASCTLYVSDTTTPTIRLLAPDTGATISTLPVSIKAIVTDLAGINMATFNGSSMTFAGDTASCTASSIDSGESVDSIVAIDNVGNKATLLFRLTYSGKKLYPPQIKDLSRATSEGRPFPPVFLDTCIVITDPAIVDKAAFAKDSVRWEIRDSSGLLLGYDLNTHLFTIPFPADSAFFGTIKTTFKVIVTNTPALYDTKQPSFFVTQANFPPVITLSPDQCFKALQTDTINLNAATTAHDPNDPLTSLNWTISKGTHFKVDSVYSSRILAKASESEVLPIVNPIIPFQFFTRRVVIDAISAADTSFYGTDTLVFTAQDPGGLVASKKIYFTRTKGLCLFHL
jgi:hypothetical protein